METRKAIEHINGLLIQNPEKLMKEWRHSKEWVDSCRKII